MASTDASTSSGAQKIIELRVSCLESLSRILSMKFDHFELVWLDFCFTYRLSSQNSKERSMKEATKSSSTWSTSLSVGANGRSKRGTITFQTWTVWCDLNTLTCQSYPPRPTLSWKLTSRSSKGGRIYTLTYRRLSIDQICALISTLDSSSR